LALLGSGALRQECLNLAAGRTNIRIIGFVDNVRDYLHSADFFVSASLTEGCPNAVMEAMACGLPVILSDILPHREILDYDSRAGLLFSSQNSDSLSNALSKALAIDYEEQASAALDIMANHLNAEVMSAKYQELYTRLEKNSG
jgi:glycosyltransferase involved in cell wall biosynthesis